MRASTEKELVLGRLAQQVLDVNRPSAHCPLDELSFAAQQFKAAASHMLHCLRETEAESFDGEGAGSGA